ncbi:fungal hydrophobin [Lentinus brumalis]|uniref:Hydrophobin n=1 Tax=Lentinus brumalis TaxID=2498619 RepID=A0A371DWV9_9APHY|nr:fungal hydrophobin [Polyporus brumalis]
MRSTLICFVLALIVTTVLAATPGESNARRMARGLPPRAPRRLYRNELPSGVAAAKRASPSGSPPPTPLCSTGAVQCCNRITTARDGTAGLILSLLGIVVKDLNLPLGITCIPLSDNDVGSGTCSTTPVCCADNSFNGIIALGCVPGV